MIPYFFYGSGMYRKHPNHTYGRNRNDSANNWATVTEAVLTNVCVESSKEIKMMHYWQEVLKVMEITGRNPSSRIKDSQIRGRSTVWCWGLVRLGMVRYG